ncbi:MAG TPA: hypothetical protein VHU18_13580 [Rhizomicrobium sp.]|jgi:hypothetical protein|nr:hypothetical protein [Rhizomicrobium sp.]
MAEGIYRIADGWCLGENSILLGSREGFRIEIPEHSYVEQGYEPPLDDLMWLGPRPDLPRGLPPDQRA